MENPRMQTPRTSTSSATTIWECAVLLCLALDYILQDSPRHVQYREKVRQDGQSTPKYQSEAPHQNGPRGGGESTAGYRLHKKSQTIPKQSHSQPRKERQDSHHNDHAYPFKTDLRGLSPSISRVQKREAWNRIRAVSNLPDYPATANMSKGQNEGEKRAKKVRWGVTQTRQFESEAGSDDEDMEIQHSSSKEKNRTHRSYVSDQERRGEQATKEVWAPVEAEGQHEPWGPIKAGDGQFE